MKYKVIKDFGSAKKGDILEEDETGLVSFQVEEDGMYRSMSLDYETADFFCEEKLLTVIEDPDESDIINSAIELIDTLLEQYDSDLEETLTEASQGLIQPCVKLEAETVYFNLTKVLTKIKDVLEGKETEVKELEHE